MPAQPSISRSQCIASTPHVEVCEGVAPRWRPHKRAAAEQLSSNTTLTSKHSSNLISAEHDKVSSSGIKPTLHRSAFCYSNITSRQGTLHPCSSSSSEKERTEKGRDERYSSKYENSSKHRRRTITRKLDSSKTEDGQELDVSFLQVDQL